MMMRIYQAYPEYKDSGVEWLGEVPKYWEKSKVKFQGSVKGRIGFRGYTVDDLVERENGALVIGASEINSKGDIILNNPQYISWEKYYESPEIMLEEGMVLVVQRGSVGKIAYVPNKLGKSTINPSLIVLRDLKIDPKYLTYSLMSIAIQNLVIMQTSSTAVPMISQEQVSNYWLLVPSVEEQTQIANFLDHKTAKIDTLIEKQQQLIKLLKEKRQAVISHAVTKGLNPQAPMKNSGVEWLGEVPAHWVVTKAKFVSKIFVPQRNKPELNDAHGVSWATMEDMRDRYIESTRHRVDDESIKIAGSKILRAGAVIASCVGNFGVASINSIDVIINQQLQAFIPNSIKAEYLREIITLSKTYFELIGTAATLVYVNQQGFESLPVLIPPMEEQENICSYATAECGNYDKLVVQCNKTIDLLKERRTALISAAVTGKIDVRNWKAPYQTQTHKEKAA